MRKRVEAGRNQQDAALGRAAGHQAGGHRGRIKCASVPAHEAPEASALTAGPLPAPPPQLKSASSKQPSDGPVST